MSTIELAKQLGLIETIQVNTNITTKYSHQNFQYLFVLDFESTCWDSNDINKGKPEIIEFSVVLYDVKSNSILSEFQQYVMCVETSRLTEFCKNLTGIEQEQVDNGMPLGTCVMVFMKWLKDKLQMYNMAFPTSAKEPNKKQCIFATWSDWDLGTCLNNECKRKRITKPTVFNQWIDIRALYREYYHRRPKGLGGALTEVGLTFKGREHCGLHDARNTAFLAGRMISDGILLRVTKTLS